MIIDGHVHICGPPLIVMPDQLKRKTGESGTIVDGDITHDLEAAQELWNIMKQFAFLGQPRITYVLGVVRLLQQIQLYKF